MIKDFAGREMKVGDWIAVAASGDRAGMYGAVIEAMNVKPSTVRKLVGQRYQYMPSEKWTVTIRMDSSKRRQTLDAGSLCGRCVVVEKNKP